MPFVPVKCTSCGGDIQLDNQRQTGFCSYCGAQVIFEEAIKKMEIAGSVSVEGIATLEKKLEDAATFKKLGNNEREGELLQKITDEYPGDYRGWWQLALNRQRELSYDPSKYALFSSYHFPSKDDRIEQFKIIYEYTNNAITLAPPEKSHELKARAKECYEKELEFLEGGLGYWEDRRNKLIEMKNDKQKYDRAVRAIYRRGTESYKRARVQRGGLQ